MSYVSKKHQSQKSEYSIVYSDMRGVDFSGDGSGISRSRFAYAENMYRDYDGDGDGITESIPGFRKLTALGERINGIFSHKDNEGKDNVVVHAGTKLYRFLLDDIDELEELTPIGSIANRKSKSFAFGGELFILDGENLHTVSADGTHSTVGDGASLSGYIPTTYLNGTEYQQRNLLTRSFKECFLVGSGESVAYGTPGLKYEITDDIAMECKLTGADNAVAGEVFIPSRVLIGDKHYNVKEIANRCFFGNTAITKITISHGIHRVGKFAFASCTSLVAVILPDSVTFIDNAAFDSCTALTSLHFGERLEGLGNSVISFCTNLKTITYAASNSEFSLISNTSVLGSTEIAYNVKKSEILVDIPVFSPASVIASVTVDGINQEFEAIYSGAVVSSVHLLFGDRADITGKEIILHGTLSSNRVDYSGKGGFLASSFAKDDIPENIIKGCTVAESFDGRIFLAGNPKYPNTVFYSARDLEGEISPLYFGDMNYFCDGIGPFNTIALLAAGDSLAVFKEGDDGGGSIYYHSGADTGSNLVPRIYPVSYIHSGICAYPAAISFFDDPVFVSPHGISALNKKAINLERSVATRSHNVNSKLLCENLSEASLAVWRGYLVVAVGKNIYLADSRATFTHETGNTEYEWYFLTGIGSHTSSRRVYRHCSTPYDGYSTPIELADTKASGVVISEASKYGLMHYTLINGVKHAVYPTEELHKGVFHPQCAIFVLGERLFFGTDNGDICVFNNDMRGVPPDSLLNSDDFDAEDYKERFGRRIHPEFYSFDMHAPRYALKTAYDNGGIPHMLKSSVKQSLAIKCRAFAAGSLTCEVGTNVAGYREVCDFSGASLSFADIDFSSTSLAVGESFTLSVSEKEKGWIEKQISIYSEEYNSPIGIYSIAYRFRIKGRLKKNI